MFSDVEWVTLGRRVVFEWRDVVLARRRYRGIAPSFTNPSRAEILVSRHNIITDAKRQRIYNAPRSPMYYLCWLVDLSSIYGEFPKILTRKRVNVFGFLAAFSTGVAPFYHKCVFGSSATCRFSLETEY